jgi:hypothetical protein
MDNSQFAQQIDRIEAMLDVLLTLEKERRMNQQKRPYEYIVAEVNRLILDAQAAIVSRRDQT